MKNTLLLSLIIYGLVLAGLGTRNGTFLVLAIPIMLYLAIGLLYEPQQPKLKIKRIISADRITPGQNVTITLIVTNEGQPLEELYLADVVPASLKIIEGQTTLLTSFPSAKTVTLEYTVLGQRGLYRFLEVKVRVNEYLGLFSTKLNLEAANQFFVLPEIAKVKQIAIRPPRTGLYSGLVPARQGGPGIEFFGIREYQAGDPMRWVNERVSARYQQTLFVNEFQQERVVDVGLILDARQQSDARRRNAQQDASSKEIESLFEYSIRATATLSDSFLGNGNRVGLFIYGRSLNWTFPGYGKMQRERIIRALAQAQQGEGKIFEQLEYLPTRLFPVRTQLVLISPLLPDDVDMLIRLRARGYRLLVISPDPISYERKTLPDTQNVNLATHIARVERNLILTQLQQAGIQVLDWPIEIPFHQIAHVALNRVPAQR